MLLALVGFVASVTGVTLLLGLVWPAPTSSTCGGESMGPYDSCSGLSSSDQLTKNQTDHWTLVAIIALVIIVALLLFFYSRKKSATRKENNQKK